MLPSTHPAPVLFPSAGQPLSAVGIVRCSPCYPVVSLLPLGDNLWTEEMRGAEVTYISCNLFEFLFRGGCVMLA